MNHTIEAHIECLLAQLPLEEKFAQPLAEVGRIGTRLVAVTPISSYEHRF
jgi:hypothetical protein